MWMLHFAQHDNTDRVIPNALFCHSERSEESSAIWMLRFAQHDREKKRRSAQHGRAVAFLHFCYQPERILFSISSAMVVIARAMACC